MGPGETEQSAQNIEAKVQAMTEEELRYAIVHVLNKLTGEDKSDSKRVDLLSEADMFYELMEKSCWTGEGWNDNLFQGTLKMDDDTTQKMKWMRGKSRRLKRQNGGGVKRK